MIFVLKNVLLLQLLVIVSIPVRYISCNFCKGKEDTSKCGICALCFDIYAFDTIPINHVGQTKVVGFNCLPKSYGIFKDPPKCDFVDKCLENPCENNATCNTFFGTALCFCGTSNYGQRCEHDKSDKKGYLTDVKVLYKPIVKALDGLQLMISFSDKFKNNNPISVTIADGQQQFIQLNSRAFRKSNPRRECMASSIATPRLCNLLANENDYFYTVVKLFYRSNPTKISDYILGTTAFKTQQKSGYISHVDITISDEMTPDRIIFDETYYIIVYTNDDMETCPLTVILQNCAPESWTPIKFTRTEERIISGHVDRPETCIPKNITLYWKIWRFGLNFDETRKIPVYESVNIKKYTIKPFSLKRGIYRIKLTAEVNYGENRVASDFAYCFFEILDLSLIAIISGGNSRTAYAKSPLVLDASSSEDPNEPHNRQFHLMFTWSCDHKDASFCAHHITKSKTYQVDGPFEPNQTYRFELTVSGKNLPSVTTSQLVVMTPVKMPNMMIRCYLNCGKKSVGVNPDYQVYLIVEVEGESVPQYKGFTWSYEQNGINKTNIKDITYDNLPPHICIIKPHVLAERNNYTFVVTRWDPYSVSTINIKVHTRPSKGTCYITPSAGNPLNTTFELGCFDFKVDALSNVLTYEFYNDRPEEEGIGILVAYNTGSHVYRMLVNKYLKIRVIDFSGMYTEDMYSPKINRVNARYVNMNHMKALAKAKLERDDAVGALTLLTMATEYLNLYPDKGSHIMSILSIVEQDKMLDSRRLNRVLAVVYRTLDRGVRDYEHGLSFSSAIKAMKLLRGLCKGYYKRVTSYNNTISIIVDHTDLSKTIFSLFVSIITVVEGSEQSVKYHKRNVELVSLKYSYLIEIFVALDSLMKTAHLCLLPAQEPVVIKINQTSRFYSKADLPTRLAKLGKIPNDGVSYVRIQEDVAEKLENTYGYVTLQVAVFNRNPFWFDLLSIFGDIVTHVIYCKLTQKTLNTRYFKEFINHLNSPMDMYLKVNEDVYAEINGSVWLPPSDLNAEQLDETVLVYRLNCPEFGGSSGIRIKFQNLSLEQVLRVVILYNMWPDYDIMMEKSTNITKDNPTIELIAFCENEDAFNYIGILPGNEYPINKEMNYSFQVYTVQCLTRIQNTWTPEHCMVLPKMKHGYVHCQCYYMSYISGTYLVLPEKRDIFMNVELFLTPMDNKNCVIFLASVFTIYILLLIYSRYNDRKDKKHVYINVLEDNVPGDTWPYLIVVRTSGRMFSGTTAHVGIKLIGSLGTSREHILLNSERQTMQKWCDDWFLIFTTEYLGNIKAVNIWHDWMGYWSDWYCNDIVVYDLSLRKEYYFLVNSWTSTSLDYSSEINIYPSKPLTKHIFIKNLVINMRTLHLFIGIFIRPPRSSLTRTQMLGVQMTLVMLIMFMSYWYLDNSQVENIDSLHLNIDLYDFLVVFFSSTISYFITSFQAIIFRKSTPAYDFMKISLPKVENPINYVENKKELQDIETGNELSEDCRNKIKDVGFSIKEIEEGENFLFLHLRFKPVVMKDEVQKYSKSKRTFLIISWTLFAFAFCCVLSIVPSTFSKGVNNSSHWMIVTVLAYVYTLLVIYPFKILIYTLIYTFIYKKSNPENCFICNTTTQPELKYNKEFMEKLTIQRSHAMYSKMPESELAKKQKFENLSIMWANLIDLIVVLLYIIFISIILFYRQMTYRTKANLIDTFSGSCIKSGYMFDNVVDVGSFNTFLTDKFMKSCYRKTYYSGKKIDYEGKSDVSGWICNYNHRLIGVPRIRQIRVKREACIVPKIMSSALIGGKLCSSGLNEHTEDKGDYGIAWSKLIISKLTNFISPWKYTYANQTREKVTIGPSKKVYHGGGYFKDLSRIPDVTNKTIRILISNNWLNENTRVAFIEFSVYNVNINTISEIMIVVEFLPSMTTLVEIQVESFKFPLRYSYLIINLAIFILYFLPRIIMKINHEVKSNFTYLRLIEVFMVLAGIIYLFIYITQLYESMKLVDKFRTNGLDNYFTFKGGIILQYFKSISLLVHFPCTVLFLLKSYRFGGRMQKFYFIFAVEKTFNFLFLLIIPIITSCCLVVTFLLFNPPFPNTNVFITSKLGIKKLLVLSNFPDNRLPPFIFCVMNNFMIWMYTLFLIVSYKKVKALPITSEYKDNLLTFLCEDKQKTKNERLRGGFDSTWKQTACIGNYGECYSELEKNSSATQHVKNYRKIAVFNDIILKLNMIEEKLYAI